MKDWTDKHKKIEIALADGLAHYRHGVEENTEDYLNESNELVTVCGYDYEAGTLLRRADGVAFSEEVAKFLQNYTELDYNGSTVYVSNDYLDTLFAESEEENE